MSGLGHFLESEGLATTGLSLIREHAELARPPRSLVVPFDFGHPFGEPGEATLQRDVLRKALALFERAAGPVLEDWQGEAGNAALHPDGSGSPWVCPIPLHQSPSKATSEEERLCGDAQSELEKLLPWYEHAVSERGRTTVGACGLAVPELLPFIAGFLEPTPPETPNPALPAGIALKTTCEDLKQIYLEAASAQPTPEGASRPGHAQQNDWFWRETRAADLIRAVGQRIQHDDDPAMAMVSTYLLLPFMRSRPSA